MKLEDSLNSYFIRVTTKIRGVAGDLHSCDKLGISEKEPEMSNIIYTPVSVCPFPAGDLPSWRKRLSCT